MAHTLQPNVALSNRYDTSWLAALIVTIALIVMFVGIGLNGVELPTVTGPVAGFDGQPETIEQTVPAYIQESIVFGDRAPGEVSPSAEIMPVHLVEAGYFE